MSRKSHEFDFNMETCPFTGWFTKPVRDYTLSPMLSVADPTVLLLAVCNRTIPFHDSTLVFEAYGFLSIPQANKYLGLF